MFYKIKTKILLTVIYLIGDLRVWGSLWPSSPFSVLSLMGKSKAFKFPLRIKGKALWSPKLRILEEYN